MGKEAKIGLAVIFVLLVVFAAALYKRFASGHSGPADASAAAEADSQQQSLPPDSPNGSELFPPAAPKIVAAKSGSGNLPETSKVDYLSDWSVASDEKDSPQTAGAAASTPPSFMPKLVDAAPSPDPANVPGGEPPRYADFAPPSGAIADPAAAQLAQRPGPFTANVLSEPVRSTNPAASADPFNSQNQGNPLRDSSGAAPMPGGYGQGGPANPYSAANPYQTPGYRSPSHSTYRTPSESAGAAGRYQVPGGYNGGGLNQPLGVAQPRSADGSYVVEPNDNYWTISERVYGTGAYFRALAEHNRKNVPEADQLLPGEKISAPTVAELEKNYRDLCPKPEHREVAQQHIATVSAVSPLGGGRVYVVQEGDTLFDIARFELGKASRWAEVFQLNRHVLGDQYDYLTPGMQLLLPSDRPAETLAERPGAALQR